MIIAFPVLQMRVRRYPTARQIRRGWSVSMRGCMAHRAALELGRESHRLAELWLDRQGALMFRPGLADREANERRNAAADHYVDGIHQQLDAARRLTRQAQDRAARLLAMEDDHLADDEAELLDELDQRVERPAVVLSYVPRRGSGS